MVAWIQEVEQEYYLFIDKRDVNTKELQRCKYISPMEVVD